MSAEKERFIFAKKMIVEAGEYLLSLKSEASSIQKKAENDFVTQADKKNEDYIIRCIKEFYPQDGVFGEESGKHDSKEAGRWVIDPIDGTVNFMHDFPCFTISIAYEDKDGELIFGLVYVPSQKELFSAFKGEGASLNGTELKIKPSDPEKGLALCVYPHRKREYLDYYQERMRKILDLVSDLRSVGSAALSLCYVAASRCVLYYEMFLNWYDIAAGILILKEAGGKLYIKRENDYPIHILAASDIIFDKALEAIDD